MKKQILTLSVIAALTGCDLENLDNSEAKEVPANFNNEFSTQVGFDGTKGKGLDLEVTFGHGNASGVIGVTDVNYGEADPNYELVPEGKYGIFTMTEDGDGEWSYDLDETHPDVAALQGNPSASLTEVLTITSLDGTTTTLNIKINGTPAESAAEFRGAFVANVSLTETDGFGTANVYDENFEQSYFLPVPAEGEDGGPKYGTFTIAPNGQWTYELNKRHEDFADWVGPDHQASETFMVKSTDGTETEFKVNITGAPINFAAQIPSVADEDSVFAINFANGGIAKADTKDGKITFKAKITEDLPVKGFIGFSCSDKWHDTDDKRRLSSFWVQPDGQFEMWSSPIIPGGSYDNGIADYAKNDKNQYDSDHVIFDQMFTPGEWTEIEFSWVQASPRPLITLDIDGETATSSHGAIPVDPTKKITAQTLGGTTIVGCNGDMRLIVKKDADNGGIGALLVDDIKYFTDPDADVKFDTPVFEENFANNEDGDDVTESSNIKFFEAITTDNIKVVLDR